MELGSDTYERIIEEVDDYALLLLDSNGNIEKWNKGAERIKGYNNAEIIGKNISIFYTAEDQIKKKPEQLLAEAKEKGKVTSEGWRVKKDGTRFWTRVTLMPLYDTNKKISGFTKVIHDLTKQKLVEEKLINSNRLYAFISEINQTIVHVQDDSTLFSEACRIATDIGKFDQAWIGIPDRTNKKFNIVASSGASKDDLERLASVVYEDDGPTAKVLNSGNFHVVNDMRSDIANHHAKSFADDKGFRSCIVLPIRKSGNVVGTYNLLSCRPNRFDEDEIRLLDEISGDISFAVDLIEQEKYRNHMEDRLVHSEIHLKQAQAIAHFGSWEHDFSTGIITWSEETCRIYGVDINQTIQSFDSWLTYIHPEDKDYVVKTTSENEKKLTSFSFSFRIIRKDGALRQIESQVHFETDKEGVPVGLYGVVHDVTRQKDAEERLINVNRLYAFISEINQTIVHATDEETVFRKACKIATDVGKFKMAWIGIVDTAATTINLIESSCVIEEDIKLFTNSKYAKNGPQDHVITTGSNYVCNDFEKDFELDHWRQYISRHDLRSMMTLPIKKSGTIYATLNLYSSKLNLFDEEEIHLLEKVASDLSFALDIFEKEAHRKQMMQKVEHNELRLKQAQAIAHLGSWELNFATGIAEWSDEACRIFGLETDERLQTYQSWLSFIHPDDLDYVLGVIAEGEKDAASYDFHHRIKQRNGTVKHIYSQVHYDFDSSGIPIGLYGVSHDVTTTKEAEDALRQSQANLRLIVDLIPQAIFAKDYDGRFVFMNKSFAALYGLTPKEMIRKTARESIPDKNIADYFLIQDQNVIQSGKTQIIPEETFTDYKGVTRLYHTTKVPFTVAGKNIKAVLGIAIDITEQKKAETERTKMIADIVQRNKDLEQFSYILSHNLRAPVANILGLTELMQISGFESKDERELVDAMSIAIKKLDNVIMDLNYILQVKPAENKKMELVKLSELLSDIKLSISNLIVSEGVTINADFSEIDEIHTLKSYIYSIFFNLISNSIKYRNPKVNPIIEIKSKKIADKILITIKDNGLGLDLEKKGMEIFGLYKRFHGHVEGKGMGLFMVKRQVESLNGQINISSELNKGTEFTLEFKID